MFVRICEKYHRTRCASTCTIKTGKTGGFDQKLSDLLSSFATVCRASDNI